MVTPYETEENNNEDGKGSKKTKAKPELPVYKYSKMGREDLYESIILGGIPIFVTYDEIN
jgi:hypothetical protein